MSTPSMPPVIMPILFVALLLLPMRLSNTAMKGLAFLLWLIGGLFLSIRGIYFLTEAHPNLTTLGILALVGLVIGFGKGKFVLSKTSQRNIERIEQFTHPQKPIAVYSMRSWVMISLMVGISLALTLFHAPDLVRGTVNLAIGIALTVSSLSYLRPSNNAAPSLSGEA